MTNIFTVDLEDWFHVCGVSALSRDKWSALPSRVGDTTRWLLDTLDAAGVRATFFVLGWIADEHPELVAAVRSAGHDIGSHGHDHLRAYELTADGVRRRSSEECCRLAVRRRDARDSVPRARMVHQRSLALGAG